MRVTLLHNPGSGGERHDHEDLQRPVHDAGHELVHRSIHDPGKAWPGGVDTDEAFVELSPGHALELWLP